MFYLGIDQHKRFSQVAVLDEKGKVIDERKLHHDAPDAMRQYLRQFSEGVAALEATSNWDWLYELLEEELQAVKMSHPSRTRLIAEAKVKTDKVDARVLAQLLRTGFLPEAYAPERPVRDGRELQRYRVRLVGLQTMLKNRVHALLGRQNIQYEQTDLFGKSGRRFLEQLRLREPYALELKSILRLLDGLAAELKLIRAEIRKALQDDPRAALLMSMPGVGELIAYLILYEIGDAKRFSDARHFASYCCLVPRTRQSAEHVHHGHVGRAGNLMLKWAFVEAAHVAKRKDPHMRAIASRLTRKIGSGRATVAVARKLAISAFNILTKEQPYRYRTSGWSTGKPACHAGH